VTCNDVSSDLPHHIISVRGRKWDVLY